MVVIICPCGKNVETFPSRANRKKYCSKTCFYRFHGRPSGLVYKIKVKNKAWFKKGNVPWTKGLSEHLHPHWKGDFAGYDAIHSWVEKHLGKPKKCDKCKTKKSKIYQWSNKSGKYKRVLSDWQRLCIKCHSRYDYEKFGARRVFYE